MKKWLFFFSALIAAACLFGCGARPEPEKFERTALYFDTVVQITFYTEGDGDALMDHCMGLLDGFEKTFSRTDPESELYAVNHREEQRVEVSGDLAELVRAGLSYYECSEEKFDITVAPLTDLWDFKSEDARVPDKDAIRQALAKVDASKVHVEGNTLLFDSPDTMLDLGALAKGYAADRLKEYLTGAGAEHGLINLGGNVLTIGARPDGSKWRIGVQKPFAEHTETAAVVRVEDQTVVSSGIYERYFEQDGNLYHHILDPDTGYPADSDLQGVSVICDSSLEGDALSTTCLLLGYEKATKLILQREGAEAVFLTEEDVSATKGCDLAEKNAGEVRRI